MTYKRTSYEDMQNLILSNYYFYCRQKIKSGRGWLPPDQEHEISFAYEQLDNAFDFPVERLMLEVLVLIFDAGRGSEKFFPSTEIKSSQLCRR